MKKIVGIINPFDIYQTFYFYEDGSQLEKICIQIKDIPETVLSLSHKYDVYKVDLCGAEHFIEGIIKLIQAKEITEYNENKLIIKCI